MDSITFYTTIVRDGQEVNCSISLFNGCADNPPVAISINALSQSARLRAYKLRQNYRRPVYALRSGGGFQLLLDRVDPRAMLVVGQ